MNKQNIVAFDVETTGLDSSKDYVIQLSAVKFDAVEFNVVDEFNHYVLPHASDWEIADGAFEKHGISKEYLETHGESLQVVGNQFIKFIDGCDMLSYNGNKFDIKMLSKDLHAFGYTIDLNRVFYDSLLLEAKLFPRTLETIYKKYTGNDLDGAHNSLNDVYATIEVFKHQVKLFESQDITLDDIMCFDESKIFCIDGMIKQDGDKILFAKGKYKDVEFMEVANKDVGYVKWFMNNSDFSNHTKNTLRNYYIKNRQTAV